MQETKNTAKSWRYLLHSAEKVLDFVLNYIVAYACYTFFIGTLNNQLKLQIGEAVLLIAVVCLGQAFLYNYHNVYAPMRTRNPLYFIARIFLVNAQLILLLLLIIMAVYDDPAQPYFISWLVSAASISFFIMTLKKVFMITVLHTFRRNSRNIKHLLLVTDSQEMADAFMEEVLSNPQFGYSVIGYVGNLNIIGLPHLGTTGNLEKVLQERRPDEVILAMDTVRKKLITKYIDVCNNNCAKVMVVPAICGYFRSPRQVNVIGNLPIIDIRSTPLDNYTNQMLKRGMDIVGSLIMILLTSPVMLFTAIGVRLSSPGPILFKQIRVGRNNKEFTMYKFRSMRVNDSEQTGWSTDYDPRKTRFGAFIRKYALDELPQFFNILKGDMSLVGPRPEVPFYVEKFKKEIPLYMLKHTLRPGLTGQAQIKGLRGDTSIQARIEEDINYIENWSFWGDIRILLLTPFRAVNRHERYAKVDKARETHAAAKHKWDNSHVEDMIHDEEEE